MNVRTRNAPSPTGYAHLATIYQSMINKAIALKNGGTYILRVEDTDQNRYVEGAVDAVFSALDWFGLQPDESMKHGGSFGPYIQSQRLNLYKRYAEELIQKGHAYYCFCTEDRLKNLREDQIKNKIPPMYDRFCRNLDLQEAEDRFKNGEKHVIRLKIPLNSRITVHDHIRGDVEFDANTIDDQVLLKSDGYPTYHLAVVVDDHLMEISHTVRGPEYITSFPKHKLLYDYFGWQMPVFIHTPLITNMDNSKLSKRQGHASADWYRRRGFLPEAVLNFIALLGWSHPEGKEIFDYSEFVRLFDPKDLSALSPKFDLVKLEWMNGQYIQQKDSSKLIEDILTWLNYCLTNKYQGATEFQSDWDANLYQKFKLFIESLDKEKRILFGDINKERIKKFEDLLSLNKFFIEDIKVEGTLLTQYRTSEELKSHLNWVLEQINSIEFTLSNLKELETKIKNRAEELNWKIMEVFFPIRIAICRNKISPPLFESIYILGKERSIQRIHEAIDYL